MMTMATQMTTTAIMGMAAISSDAIPAAPSSLPQPEPQLVPAKTTSQQQGKRSKPSRNRKHGASKAIKAAGAEEPLVPAFEEARVVPVASQQPQRKPAASSMLLAPPSRVPKRRAEPLAQACEVGVQVTHCSSQSELPPPS